ncbi:MAG TPA: Crp/Fnr family transcriptional regulator [Pyrinomonadaceae bacterium]|jgi:cAMP-binding proteins - catabolite gene activator and regulatory subunit of cAMP-dependent protein kinases|nr:Crp/Fnr family transcriptional regulator [Pyrinomonadaceae bacterium]
MKVVQDQKRARDLTPNDRAEIIRRLDFGSSLNETVVSDLSNSSVVLDFRRRRFVYRAGEPADCLYAIINGRVKLCRIESDTSREAVIDILPEGSLFGESALYSAAGQRANSAVAYENLRLLRIHVADFKRGMAEDDRLHDYTFRLIGQRLDHAERRLADFALNAIPARLDRLLAEFSDRYGVSEPEGVLIDIPLPHREIASIVGSTRESVTVRLNAMRREGTIEFVNRRILIKRPTSPV